MLATALAPEIGYDAAAALAKEALKTGRTIRELAAERGIAPDRLDELLDPAAMTEPGLAAAGRAADRQARPARAGRPLQSRRCPRPVPGTAPGPCPPRVRPPAARGRGPARRAAHRRQLFTFMRDAELRFETLRMRIEEHAWTARARSSTRHDVDRSAIPARRRCSTSTPASRRHRAYEAWVSDGTTVQTYVGVRRLGTRAAGPATRPRRDGRPGPARPVAASTSRSRRFRRRRCRSCSSTRPATARTCSRPAPAGSPGRRPSPAARRSSSSATTRGRSR